ncbi:RCC1 domain-containing protein [Pseudobutyrivibrio xylanivorans]|uniref:Regulator of chromosome condensation (RCC1) repeat-containing protein n=1 Tax=Pseudobutyrivibrio xylanivorans DSM 14809 TaxID=1123012 RepID=A0A1M6JEW0_PSEXY|nr:hypothetical protein [Pseudobutyrivibrio xylanivorans]SHJ45249.1 Regulator of chromosome condensation (RCC1) repeat-containing protein [Pseudobutyrivibrio xylanivorans DSM 14809]
MLIKNIRKKISYVIILFVLIAMTSCGDSASSNSNNQHEENNSNYKDILEEGDVIEDSDKEETSDCEDAQEEKIDEFIAERATTISAGIRAISVIGDNSEVSFYGDGFAGQDASKQWKDMLSISVFGNYVIGLNCDGEVKICGDSTEKLNISDWEDIIAVDTGENYVIGLDRNGKVYTAGHNGDGQIDVDSWENIKLISAAWRHTAGVSEDNHIYITGYKAKKQENELNNQLKGNYEIVKVATGGGYEKYSGHTVVLTSDGRVFASGDNTYGQCNVEDWSDIVDIAAGDWHTVGVKADGTVVVTGDAGTNYSGKNSFDKWKDVIAVSAGRGYTLGLTVDGKVLTAGYDKQNEMGVLKKETQEMKRIKIYDEWWTMKNTNIKK